MVGLSGKSESRHTDCQTTLSSVGDVPSESRRGFLFDTYFSLFIFSELCTYSA